MRISSTAQRSNRASEQINRDALEIARGSVFKSAAIQDVLVVGNALGENESKEHKAELDRMASMLSRLGGRGYKVSDELDTFGVREFDTDSDTDTDSDSDDEDGKSKTGELS
jgi:hypothetical protein